MKRLNLTKISAGKRLEKVLGISLVIMGITWTLSAQSARNFDRLPLRFEAVQNLPESSGQFVAHERDSAILIGSTNVQFAFRQANGKGAVAQIQFAGANPLARSVGALEMSGKVNYLIGNDPSQWRTGLPLFGQVRIDQLYPGINVVYYGNQQQLEYDFDLAPNVDPGAIVFRFFGTDKISVNKQGELVLHLAGGQVIERQPVAYQMVNGIRQGVRAGYKILDARTAVFALGDYNHRSPLVIDPVISYSTYFGGNAAVVPEDVALGTNDNSVFIAGLTLASELSTPGAFEGYQGAANYNDAFVAKFDHTGTNLVYCTYLGGSMEDDGYALAVDAAGNAFVTGLTLSSDFPVKNGAVAGTFNGSHIQGTNNFSTHQYPCNAFVSELNTNGSQLIYSTYLGGGAVTEAFGITVDPYDNTYVTGTTFAKDFPTTANAFQKSPAMIYTYYSTGNAFISEIASNGNTLAYSTYLGGINLDWGMAISYNNGYLAVAGYTSSTNFPTANFINQSVVNEFSAGTNEAYYTNYYNGSWINNTAAQQALAATWDTFVTEFVVTNTGLALRYSTFLGGSGVDQAAWVAVDAVGNADVVGGTSSLDFPNTTNGQVFPSFISTNSAGVAASNPFLTQIQYAGTNAVIGFSRIFGGAGTDTATGVALDATGNIFVVGAATSSNFPTTSNLLGSLANTNAGLSDAFITVFAPNFSVLYSAYLGGENNDYAQAVVVDSADNAYVTGHTLSTYFPTFSPYDGGLSSPVCGFLVKILPTNTIPELTLQTQGTNVLVSWPVVPFEQATPNFLVLESNTNLLSTNWIPVAQTPVLTNANYVYTFGQTNQTLFFQLQSF